MKLLTSILFTFSLFAASAHAAIIVQDDFNRNGALAGSAASVTLGLWNGGAQTTNSLANVTYNASAGDFSYQSFTIAASSVYQLSVDMEALGQAAAGSSNWLGFGFGGVVGSTNSASILLENSGTSIAYQTGSVGSQTGAPNGKFMIQLNTSASLVGSSVRYFRGGLPFASGTIDATGINRVFLQNINDMKGIYDNFLLTGPVVPEPSSALLGAVGVLGLAIRRRR
jgi:MYXO-CTERM domain-containing protein